MPDLSVERLRRVARRPPRYVIWRLSDEARRRLLRRRVRDAAHGRGALALDRLLPDSDGSAIAVTGRNADALVPAAAAIAATREDAWLRTRLEGRRDLALARCVELFGDAPIEVGVPPRWSSDPHSGHSWPQGDATTLDYVNRDRRSDIKVAWELSRLRHLVALAQCAAALEDEQAATAAAQDVASWIAQNPIGWSVNWTVGMEVALRAVNLIVIDAILRGAGSNALDRTALARSLYQHGWYLSRNREVSDVNGNHFLANAVGLLWLGSYFHGIGEAARWRTTGLAMAREAAADQVHADGLDHEGSLPYHFLVLEMFILARHAGGASLSSIDPVLERMLAAAELTLTPAGEVPDVGDDDGGRVLAFCDAPSRDGRRVLELGSRLLGRPLAARFADAWPEDAGSGCRGRACGRITARPATLPDGGIVVLGDDRDHVVVPVGPVGFRGRGGHGHLDALAPIAWLDGVEVLRDSGTGSYTGDPALRNTLRDAPAHSGVIVDERPYAQIGGGVGRLWAVHGDAVPTLIEVRGEPGFQIARARQVVPAADGTATWTREMRWSPGRLVFADRIEAPQGAAVVARCHVPLGTAGAVETVLPAGASRREETVPWSRRYGSRERGTCVIVEWIATGAVDTLQWSTARPRV